jgi:hypothetical protein
LSFSFTPVCFGVRVGLGPTLTQQSTTKDPTAKAKASLGNSLSSISIYTTIEVIITIIIPCAAAH